MNDTTVQLRVEDITAYIPKTGWTKLDHPNPALLVYQYERNDDYNKEIKLVLPNGNDYTDAVAKIHSAVKLIAALEQVSVSDIVQKIKNSAQNIAAAKSLRAVTESQETAIIGKIIQLKAESLDSDDEAGDSDGRQVIIAWDIGNNRKVNIKVSLSPENYRTACDAHKDNKTVSVMGRPEKVGKSWVLTSPASFAINETGA